MYKNFMFGLSKPELSADMWKKYTSLLNENS